jgi:imidazolonepropionase-like amidohydrolase
MGRESRGWSGLGAAAVFSACALLPPIQGSEPTAAPGEVPEAPALVLAGGTVMTAAGSTLERADILVRGGKIAAVGADLTVPANARVVDVAGRWVTPGLIDPHSHLGVYPLPHSPANADGNEASSPFTPDVRAVESFWPQDPALRRAVAGGVTTVHVLPGSANLVGGQGVTLRLRPRLAASEMRFPDAPTSMKLACGENPKRVHGKLRKAAPKTRMGEVAMLRQQLEDARAWAAERKANEPTDYAKQALADVLAGEIPIQNHCYRADEMVLRLELLDEFDVKPRAFHHAVEAYKIRERLAESGVGAVVWADWWGVKLELLDAVPANAALLDSAGVTVALHSDSPRDIQWLNREAAKAMAAGRRSGLDVGPDDAIRWITANPAWILGIDARVGTLEAGKDADLVVWSGDPLSVYTQADLVFIEGELIHDRASPDLLGGSDFELGHGGSR